MSETTIPILRDDERHLNLEQQKTRARELQRSVARGDAAAVERMHRQHPKARTTSFSEIPNQFARLSDAQIVIARELGLPSWPKLKAHIERMEAARSAIAGKAPAPDDHQTLHLRCGSDIRDRLKEAGFVGDFLEISDLYCQGPVPKSGNFLEIRARFLADEYLVPFEETLEKLRRTDADLAVATARYERIVLWFEHDSHDQLVLARVLSEFAKVRVIGRLELICIDRFPVVTRFNGLGNLSAAALRTLWEGRAPVTAKQIKLGAAVWDAFREPTPHALHAIASGGTPELPIMAPALLRQLQELPWTADGLSLMQRLLLAQLQDGPKTISALFRKLQLEQEPLVFAGDLTVWAVLREMRRAAHPPFEIDADTMQQKWPQHRLSLTEAGEAVLSGQRDWLALRPPGRWVGGIYIDAGAAVWRWSEEIRGPVQSGPLPASP